MSTRVGQRHVQYESDEGQRSWWSCFCCCKKKRSPDTGSPTEESRLVGSSDRGETYHATEEGRMEEGKRTPPRRSGSPSPKSTPTSEGHDRRAKKYWSHYGASHNGEEQLF